MLTLGRFFNHAATSSRIVVSENTSWLSFVIKLQSAVNPRHVNKSIHEILSMHESLQITDGIRYSAVPGRNLQAVQGSEGHIEVCPEFSCAPRLTLFQRGESFRIAELKFRQEPASVYFDDVHSCKREVVGEECLVRNTL